VSLRPEFSAISSQMAQIQPASTAMAEYTPTTTTQSSCRSVFSFTTVSGKERPTTSTIFLRLATAIPPTPDPTLCSCMLDTLECTQKSETMEDAEYIDMRNYPEVKQNTTEAKLLNAVCPQNEIWCLGSTSNTTVGKYGAFSMCNSTERVS
jgi:1,3-beta-glucanosyltransferase GAS1